MAEILALFPGQGSQHVGMAKELHENFKIVKEIFEEASDATHLNLKKLCFDGPESDLTLTENTQPCLLTASVAAFRVAQTELGFEPAAVAGHSLGEYSALVAAGALGLDVAARWVRERGAAMQRAVPAGEGTMAAVLSLEDSAIGALCEKATAAAQAKRAAGVEHPSVEAVVEPANFNAPGQIVIAGSVDAVQEAVALMKSDPEFSKGKAIPLQVSAPFHCRLMQPARDQMSEIFAKEDSAHRPKPLQCPYVPNRTARPTREAGVILELLVEQIDHPVLWKQSMTALLEQGFAQAIEFGPGKVLAGLMKRIGQPIGKTCAVLSMNEPTGLKTIQALLEAPQGGQS